MNVLVDSQLEDTGGRKTVTAKEPLLITHGPSHDGTSVTKV